MSSSTGSLSGKTAIVTGGGRGLGRAMALGLSRAGANVVITATRTHQEIEAVANEGAKIPVIGIPPFSTLSPAENGDINPANGDLHLEIPLGSFPQRSGEPVKIAFAYDSGIWALNGSTWHPWGNAPYTGSNGVDLYNGWYVVISTEGGVVDFDYQSQHYCAADGRGRWTDYNGFRWIAANGTTHAFPIKTTMGCRRHKGKYARFNYW